MKNNIVKIKTVIPKYLVILACISSFVYGIILYSKLNNDERDNMVAKVVIDNGIGGGKTASPTATASLMCCCKSSNPTNCTKRAYCQSDENLSATGCSSTTNVVTPTPTPLPKVDSVTGGGETIYLAADESASFNFTANSNPAGASNFSPTWSLSPTTGASGSGSGTSYTLTAEGNGTGTGSSCKTATYTVTASANDSSASATATVCKYCSPWKGPISARILSKQKRNTSKPNIGCYYYEGEQEVEGGYLYTAYYTRCCSTPISDFGGCYGNKKYLGIASDAGWEAKATTSRPFKYEGVKEEDCHPINVSVCEGSLTPPPSLTKETNSCEDVTEISYRDATICSNFDAETENNFYTIDCDRTVTAIFDYGDDNSTVTNRVLHKGGGFKFGINVKSVHTCTAKFNKDSWLEIYNKYLKKVGFVSSSLVDYVKKYDHSGWERAVDKLNASREVKSEVYNLWNTLKKLRDVVVEDYLGYIPGNSYDEQATIEITYDINDNSTTIKNQLIKDESSFVEGSYSRTNSSNKFDLTNQLKNIPEYIIISNEKNPRIVKLIPQQVYIDRFVGKGLNNDVKNINGGNKIYVDYDINGTNGDKTYPIKIELTGLGSNKSTIVNNKCNIKVIDDEYFYRPVDINNPFINSNWEIGKNWLNDNYSFTNIIKPNIWSSDAFVTIDLSKEEISSIKKSNNDYRESYPYLGLCGRVDTSDSITGKICSAIDRAIDNFQ